jgi:hypothetical protein
MSLLLQAKKMVAPNDGIEADDDDVGVLFYIERQLRKKAEAALPRARRYQLLYPIFEHRTST